MQVNIAKTKIMRFSCGEHNLADELFTFGDSTLEIVRSYQYFGVVLTSSSLICQMTTGMVEKGAQIVGAIIANMAPTNMKPWDTRLRLYNSIVIDFVLQCLSVWGINYDNLLERIQVNFFKELLSLPGNTLALIMLFVLKLA